MASDTRDDRHEPGTRPRRQLLTSGTAISRIESLLEAIVDNVICNEPMTIELLSCTSVQGKAHQALARRIQYPGGSLNEAQKFARITLILQLAHDALVSGTILTKRNIFYQHQDLFHSQKVVDKLVDDIEVTLGLDRGNLNIVASAKGVVAGRLKIRFLDGRVLDASYGDAGTVIPPAASIAGIDIGQIRWILVIEKDATFRSLSASQYWRVSTCGEGLLVTARGYPDMATRSLLHSLSTDRPEVPIFVLTDFDPDGLNIFHCYLRGCGSILSGPITHCSSIRWLGIKSCHLASLQPILQQQSDVHESPKGEQAALPSGLPNSILHINSQSGAVDLSLRDRKCIVDSLERYTTGGDTGLFTATLRRELQVMQMLGYKAEIQIIDECVKIDAWLNHNILQELESF